jgi:hypothetical protein
VSVCLCVLMYIFSHCVFAEEVEDFCVEDTLLLYIEYVGNLIDVSLQIEKCNPLLIHCVLNFYNVVSTHTLSPQFITNYQLSTHVLCNQILQCSCTTSSICKYTCTVLSTLLSTQALYHPHRN